MNLKQHWQELREQYPAIEKSPHSAAESQLAGKCQPDPAEQKQPLAGIDPVNHPSHYKGAVECIDAIAASMTHEQFCGYLKGNIQKYLFRAYTKHPDPLTDLLKAEWYLSKLITTENNNKPL